MLQFCAVADLENLREAADLLGISHSGLSKSLKVLESELGVSLFEPRGRGIAITEDGRRTYALARQLLADVDEFLDRCRGRKQAEPEVRIGTFEVFSTYFLGEFVEHEVDATPLVVRELVPGPMEQALIDGLIDIGITYLPIPRTELEFSKICALDMAVYGAPRFSGTPYVEWPFAAPTIPIVGTPTRAKGLDGWPDHDWPRQVRFQVDMMESALDLTRRGLSVVYLPRFVAGLHNRCANKKHTLHRLPLPRGFPADRRDVFLVRRRGSVDTPFVKKLMKRLRLTVRQTH